MATFVKLGQRLALPNAALAAALFSLPLTAAAADNTFERTFTVSGPVRLELSNGSGSVDIRGSADGKVHIRGKVSGSWTVLGNREKNVAEVLANPPLEQRADVIRVGKNSSWLRNVSIEYQIEVPHDTEVDGGVASGGITVDNVRGPVKASSASGYVHVYRVERDASVSAASGSIEVGTIGGGLRISSASGDINASDVKGEVSITAASGSIRVTRSGGRVEASSASGSVEIDGANNDVKVRAISGSIHVKGDPSANHYWELKTVSGSVNLRVPNNASFLLSAEATSGGIRTTLPVVLEEQSKHSLRAHVGGSSGRVEIHSVSGEINVQGT